MNIISALILATLASVLICLSGQSCPCGEIKMPSPEPTNSTQAVLDGLRFTETSDYRKEFDEAIKAARQACLNYVGKPNVAIVSDIDETLLDNRPHMRGTPMVGWKNFEPWVIQAKAPSLKPTAEFLRWAREKGFAIFLVTGRHESVRKATIENLVRDGISYDGLYMRPEGSKAPAEQFKSEFRKSIEDMGFTIVVNIGDQVSDLLGGHSQECVKLPNRMYFIN